MKKKTRKQHEGEFKKYIRGKEGKRMKERFRILDIVIG